MGVLRTIGYEKASVDDFVATLRVAGVKTVVDIRELPLSRRRGFSKTSLRQTLGSADIGYVHLVSLGDPKSGRVAAREGRVEEFREIFSRHLDTPAAQEGLRAVIDLIETGDICLLCYERDHRFCHRELVAAAISDKMAVDIVHLGVREGLARSDGAGRPRESSGSGQSASACR